MRFPPSFIERLRSHFLISEVIGKRVPIKKHGREYHGLCPFHSEKSPSFTVNDEKGFYHCFGCAAHGDAIEFVRKFERLTYPETIETLAREAGIPLPKVSEEDSHRAEVEKTLYDVIEAACQWFERQLSGSTGMIALDYVEKRGLKPETIRAFRIGYAPDERMGLHQYLLKSGFPQALQAEAGLIIVPEVGAPYDRFRGRVMFPIRNSSGKVIAFGGRLVIADPAKKLAKYLNSPETPLFSKGQLLYNLDLAKKPARDGNLAVVMEGYMDVVSTAQSGISYALATLGTAVTPEHLRLLWQLAKEPVMCLDGDAAGLRAMMRAAEVALPLLKPGYSLRFAVLPTGEDPDSYVQKHGKASFEKLLIGSHRLSQVLWETVSPQYKTNLPEGRAELDNALKNLAAKIEDPTVRNHYASYFKKLLWEKAAPAPKERSSKEWNPKDRTFKERQPQGPSEHVRRMAMQPHSIALDHAIHQLLALLMACPSLLHKSQVEETLSRMDIRVQSLAALRDTMLTAHHYVDIDDREAFTTYLRDAHHGDLPAVSLSSPFLQGMTPDNAGVLWKEMLATYDDEMEMEKLEELLKTDWDEHSHMRLSELRKKRMERVSQVAEANMA